MTRTFVIEETSLPDLPQLMLATVEALKALGGSASIHELDEAIIEREGVTEEEQALTMPNDSRPRVRYYLAWARTFLRRGGALENSARGIWALTDLGEKITSRDQTADIHAQVNEEERIRARQKRLKAKSAETADETIPVEREQSEVTDDTLTDWKAILLATLRDIDPSAFERLSQRLLREAGFVKVEVRGQTGDGGIDGVGVLRVNLVSFQIYFQCKRWKGSVGSKEIRDFRGALQGRADKGLFITTGTFTSQASEEATRDGAIAIDLIDGDRLCELLKQYNLGVATAMIEQVEINGDWFASI
ncbi:restriction endonuclease [uncultured Hoeflea sp.]|uniref:restriction endonuclease n=1 Tax=uncultured Hoeflea sp. TaxID=538666 RepID=UPI00261BBA66|nr:restriction endonuclease [uncultured Hoeflea sp.]